MAGKSSMRPGKGLNNAGRRPDAELGQALLAILGIGVAGGIAIVGGALKLGEKVLELQVKAYEKIEAQREAHREAVRALAESESEFASEPRDESLDLREDN
jgi:hypothetical protein